MSKLTDSVREDYGMIHGGAKPDGRDCSFQKKYEDIRYCKNGGRECKFRGNYIPYMVNNQISGREWECMR